MRKNQQGSTLLMVLIILLVMLILALSTVKQQLLNNGANVKEQLDTIANASSISALNEAFYRLKLSRIEIVDNDNCYKNEITNDKVLVCPVKPKYLFPDPTLGLRSLVRNARTYKGIGSSPSRLAYLLEQPRWYIVAGCNINGFSTSGINSCDSKGTGDYLAKIFSVATNPINEDEANDLGYVYYVEYDYVRK